MRKNFGLGYLANNFGGNTLAKFYVQKFYWPKWPKKLFYIEQILTFTTFSVVVLKCRVIKTGQMYMIDVAQPS